MYPHEYEVVANLTLGRQTAHLRNSFRKIYDKFAMRDGYGNSAGNIHEPPTISRISNESHGKTQIEKLKLTSNVMQSMNLDTESQE